MPSKEFLNTCKEIKTIKIQGAINIAKEETKAFYEYSLT